MNDRSCILTRQPGDRGQLLRFAASHNNELIPDINNKLPGRGCWLTATRQAVISAMKLGSFNKSFKKEMLIDPNLPDLIDALLKKSILGSLALARKSGAIVHGSTKVINHIKTGKVLAVLHNIDAAEDGKRKIEQAIFARQRLYELEKIHIFSLFTNDEVQIVFGRGNITHIAILNDNKTRGLINRINRLHYYRTGQVGHAQEGSREAE